MFDVGFKPEEKDLLKRLVSLLEEVTTRGINIKITLNGQSDDIRKKV